MSLERFKVWRIRCFLGASKELEPETLSPKTLNPKTLNPILRQKGLGIEGAARGAPPQGFRGSMRVWGLLGFRV